MRKLRNFQSKVEENLAFSSSVICISGRLDTAQQVEPKINTLIEYFGACKHTSDHFI